MIATAKKAAKAGGKVLLKYFGKNVKFEKKKDLVIKRGSGYSWDKLAAKMELVIERLLAK